ncbi:MAG: hypothetical protein VX899_10680 [Myxococcota bacterium]|nr:hypothetical protein [Myxococcota bacterium]
MEFSRLNPFEGLCLTSADLRDEQAYHRQNLHRHANYMHSHGIVQGLQVELESRQGKYLARISAGYGLTRAGQGVELEEAKQVILEVPKQDGEYMLWLFHVEQPDEHSQRPVFDTQELRAARVLERAAPALHPADEDHDGAVALARLNVRLGRIVHVKLPVPRAGRQARAAESYLKPRVVEFIRLSKKVMQNLFRTALVKELDLAVLNFSSALVSSEFLLIEEGTADRVLYRTAGSLISYAHDYYNAMPRTTDRVAKFTEFVRRVHAELPGQEQGDEVWLKWFEKFERLLTPLNKISEELEKTVEAQR